MTCVHVPTYTSATEHGKDPSLENKSLFTLLFLQSGNRCLPLNNKSSFTHLLKNGGNHNLSLLSYGKRAVIPKDTNDG